MALNVREPPKATAPGGPPLALLVGVQVVTALALAALVWAARPAPTLTGDPEVTRAVAGKLLAAGQVDQAAALYERVLWDQQAAAGSHGKLAYSLGTAFLDRGRTEEALRWFYEAESVGGAPADTAARIVHCLERLGRVHQAQAAMVSRAGLGEQAARSAGDPVVARIGEREIHASEVLRALDDLPPAYAKPFDGPDGRQAFLQKYVADELLWRKATKLEIDRDPDVRRRVDNVARQVVLDTFVEREIVGNVKVDEADLENFYTSNASVYAPEPGEAGVQAPPPPLAEVRDRVERDYRMVKVRTAYQDLVTEQLAASDVELHPEALPTPTAQGAAPPDAGGPGE